MTLSISQRKALAHPTIRLGPVPAGGVIQGGIIPAPGVRRMVDPYGPITQGDLDALKAGKVLYAIQSTPGHFRGLQFLNPQPTYIRIGANNLFYGEPVAGLTYPRPPATVTLAEFNKNLHIASVRLQQAAASDTGGWLGAHIDGVVAVVGAVLAWYVVGPMFSAGSSAPAAVTTGTTAGTTAGTVTAGTTAGTAAVVTPTVSTGVLGTGFTASQIVEGAGSLYSAAQQVQQSNAASSAAAQQAQQAQAQAVAAQQQQAQTEANIAKANQAPPLTSITPGTILTVLGIAAALLS